MIVDDSFFRLIAGMIAHDSFSVSGFAKDGLNSTFFRQDSCRAGFKGNPIVRTPVKKKAEIYMNTLMIVKL